MKTVFDAFLEDTRIFFDNMAESWDAYSQYDPAKTAAMLEIAGIAENARILDVACGTGALFPQLFALRPSYLRAIDLSPKMARIAQEKFPEAHVSAEDFYVFAESGFDAVTLYNAYPHFLDKEAFAKAAARVLKPGGRLVIFHGAGRDTINGCHAGAAVGRVSAELLSAAEEAEKLSQYFSIDIAADRRHLWLISGTAR